MAPHIDIRWDGPLDEVPSTARKVVGRRTYRRLWSVYHWLRHEMAARPRLDVSDRLRSWRRGFYAESAELYGLPRSDAAHYLSDLQAIRAASRMNAWEGLFEHRLGLRAFLLARGFAQPETAAFVYDGRILADPFTGEGTYIDHEALDRRLRDAGDTAVWVMKPEDGSASHPVVFLPNVEPWTLRFDSRSGPTLLERRVEQGDFARDLYPGSVNTLRVLTLWPPGDPAPFVARAVQRIGTSRTAGTDSWRRGGISARVDRETGRLGVGRVLPQDGSAQDELTHHPESGARIAGAMVPDWTAIRDTVLRAATSAPFNRLATWSVVSAARGAPVILSATCRADVGMLQVHGGLLADDAVRRAYQAVGEP